MFEPELRECTSCATFAFERSVFRAAADVLCALFSCSRRAISAPDLLKSSFQIRTRHSKRTLTRTIPAEVRRAFCILHRAAAKAFRLARSPQLVRLSQGKFAKAPVFARPPRSFPETKTKFQPPSVAARRPRRSLQMACLRQLSPAPLPTREHYIVKKCKLKNEVLKVGSGVRMMTDTWKFEGDFHFVNHTVKA